MTRRDVAELLALLSERDLGILEALRAHRLLTTAQIRRLHFAHGAEERHASQAAASAATMRVLTRLERHGLIARLRRRIGGVRAGSSGITWHLGAGGERLLRRLHGEQSRRRYLEPGAAFVTHALGTADLAVRLRELDRRGTVELLRLEAEPDCWQGFLGPHGARTWLKPDLFAVTANGEYEDHWFIEWDEATEHPGAVIRKALVYQRYAATGVHQAAHGLFPMVLWVVPDEGRRRVLERAFASERGVQGELFRVCVRDAFEAEITHGGVGG
jgi:hypothetical protein